jgi:hypothetical protein
MKNEFVLKRKVEYTTNENAKDGLIESLKYFFKPFGVVFFWILQPLVMAFLLFICINELKRKVKWIKE